MRPSSQPSRRPFLEPRESGSALLVALTLVALLAALASAQVAVQQSSLRQSSSYLDLSALHQYAESGIAMSVHDLRYSVSGDQGNIGTVSWTVSDDLGMDGISGTRDPGEGDGIPTPGEPNVTPVSLGPSVFNARVAVHVFNTGVAGVERIVASCTNGRQLSTVEHFVRRRVVTVPRTGATYLPPTVALNLSGDDFLIDGNDYLPDGLRGSEPSLSGLVTPEGTVSGVNEATVTSQIPLKSYDQVLGAEGSPSVGEVSPVSFDDVFADLQGAVTQTLPASQYTGGELGSFMEGSLEVTYVQGNLGLAGEGTGAGVLLVDGNLKISGEFTFHGIILVRGDVSVVGGGDGVHVFGSLAAAGSSLTVTGNADLLYSAQTLDAVDAFLANRPEYTHVMYDES